MEEVKGGISLYDVNKSITKKLRVLTKEEITNKKEEILKFIQSTHNKFYMLLCKELNYYTLFKKENTVLIVDKIENVIFELLNNYGELHSINFEDDHIEFWVQVKDDENEMHVFMFFPYDNGVIKCQ